MLEAVGVKSVEELFADIPAAVRLKRPLDLPGPLSEMELKAHIQELALHGRDFEESLYFLGAGRSYKCRRSVHGNVLRWRAPGRKRRLQPGKYGLMTSSLMLVPTASNSSA